jgi:hypothetical protein
MPTRVRGLPQNRREDKVGRTDDSRRETYNSRRLLDRPTSAPTGNWFEPGWANANQRLNCAP